MPTSNAWLNIMLKSKFYNCFSKEKNRLQIGTKLFTTTQKKNRKKKKKRKNGNTV